MLNYLWGGMIFLGIVISFFTGNTSNITNAIIDSSKEAVVVSITMLGLIAMWSGLMEIAKESGLIKKLTQKMKPFLFLLFPKIPKNHKALDYISTNIIANILGLGVASTPAGIKAMESMQTLNDKKDEASSSMCMFLIFNMSSLQLITVNIIAYRAQYNSANPSEIIVPGIIATLVSTIVGVIVAKIFERIYK